jgi:hypothetical protein
MGNQQGENEMKCDWIFVSQGWREEVTLDETALPNHGDGKIHANRGFEVVAVIQGLISRPNPLIIGVEWKPKASN